MVKYNSNILLIVVIMLAVLFLGCTGGQDVSSVVKALPEVQQFMKEHPNAKITVTYWSKEEIANSLQDISQQCGKPITPVAMYKAIVSEGDLKIVSWINADNQIVVCSITQGSSNLGNQPTSTIQPTTAPIKESKIIKIDVGQIILTDSEIIDILGTGWENSSEHKQKSPSMWNKNIQGIDLMFYKEEFDNDIKALRQNTACEISMFVFPDIESAKAFYANDDAQIVNSNNITKNNIDVGDSGFVATNNAIQGKYKPNMALIFIRNNIIVSISSFPSINLDITYKLAKKQDEKISSILDMIQSSTITPTSTIQLPSVSSRRLPPQASIMISSASTATSTITLTHTGGESIDLSKTKAIIDGINSEQHYVINQLSTTTKLFTAADNLIINTNNNHIYLNGADITANIGTTTGNFALANNFAKVTLIDLDSNQQIASMAGGSP